MDKKSLAFVDFCLYNIMNDCNCALRLAGWGGGHALEKPSRAVKVDLRQVRQHKTLFSKLTIPRFSIVAAKNIDSATI